MADDRRTADDDTEAEERVEMRRVAGRVRADAVERIGKLVERHPDEVANVLRRWMANR